LELGAGAGQTNERTDGQNPYYGRAGRPHNEDDEEKHVAIDRCVGETRTKGNRTD